MRYSVVLPRAEPGDAAETKAALKAAAELWARGEQREALRELRRAAWGCSKAGNDVRALSLSKAAKAIQVQLDAAQDGGSAPPEKQPQTRRDTPHSRKSLDAQGRVPSAPPEGRPSKRPRPSRRPGGRSANPRAPSKRPIPPETKPTPRAVAAGPRSGPQASHKVESSPPLLSDTDVELDLVVTVAPEAWRHTEPATLVGHRAARVAIAPIAGKKGTFVVRILGAGEVAPANTSIALLVALEAGARKLSQAG